MGGEPEGVGVWVVGIPEDDLAGGGRGKTGVLAKLGELFSEFFVFVLIVQFLLTIGGMEVLFAVDLLGVGVGLLLDD